jgi:hypothetical protein
MDLSLLRKIIVIFNTSVLYINHVTKITIYIILFTENECCCLECGQNFLFYRMTEKSHNPFLTHVLFATKLSTLKPENKKQCYIKCWKCPVVQWCRHSVFLMSDATQWRVSAVTRNGSPDEILSICLAQENLEIYPQTHSGKLSMNKMPDTVQQ